jgi:hypothetical protein
MLQFNTVLLGTGPVVALCFGKSDPAEEEQSCPRKGVRQIGTHTSGKVHKFNKFFCHTPMSESCGIQKVAAYFKNQTEHTNTLILLF